MTEPPKKKESKITLIRRGYDNLVKTVVRPPRIAYTTEDLGPTLKALRGAVYERTDFEVVHNKLKLKCSRWAREGEPRPTKVVLYLHSNSSCRLAVVRSPVLATCACARAALVSFDFAGCGISEGDTVTLGLRERDQVEAVLAEVRRWAPGARVCIWGRSMGAAAAFRHLGQVRRLTGALLAFSVAFSLAQPPVCECWARYTGAPIVYAGLVLEISAVVVGVAAPGVGVAVRLYTRTKFVLGAPSSSSDASEEETDRD